MNPKTKNYLLNAVALLAIILGFIIINQGPGPEAFKGMNIGSYIVEEAPLEEILVVEGNTAVFVDPTEAQIENLKQEYGEEQFYIIMDDWSWYRAEASNYLEEKGISIPIHNKRYLEFTYRNNKYYVDTRAHPQDFSMLIFFRDGKMPRIVEGLGLEAEYDNYYGEI